MIGKRLGHYEILGKLGSGGMGDVYRALDTKLNRELALKVLPAQVAQDPEHRNRFTREAQAVARLKHPNIVTIHSVEEIDGVHFLTMEYVEGATLASVIPRDGLDIARFFSYAIALADAVSTAHDEEITHRDLKPANIMFDKAGRLKVLDFGLAKMLADSTTTQNDTTLAHISNTAAGQILGTAAYMSPEQAEGKTIDARSDIFSLGIVLYEMATGVRPFRGDTPISTISAILRETPTPITQVRDHLPRHLGRVIGRCLEKNPEKRFQTARDVCSELEGLQKEIASGEYDEFVRAPDAPATAVPGMSSWRVWVGAAVVVAALAIIGYFVLVRPPAPESERMLTSRPLTSGLGVEAGGSWSPDGSFFAYYHTADGSANIAVVSATGGDPIDLVQSDADDYSPRWSPDNRWVAFASNRDDRTAVYVVPPLGGGLRKVIDTGLPPLSDRLSGTLGTAPWSSDGGTLLVSRVSEDGMTAVWKITLESGEKEQLTHPKSGEIDLGASWSFAGDRISFSRGDANGATLMVMPAAGGEPRALFSNSADAFVSSWSPDDSRLVYSASWGGQLWVIDLATSRHRQLTTGSSHEYEPIVSRAGRILYSTGGHQTDLYIHDLIGGEPQRLTRHGFNNFSARISPDGRSVVYVSDRTGDMEIWVIDLEERRERQLTDRPGVELFPDWSPDGREIAYISEREGKNELWIMDAAGGAPRKLSDHEAENPVRFAPDGSVIGFLAAGSAGNSLFVLDRATGQTRQALDGVSHFDWYRDSRHVVYSPSARESSSEIRVRDLETGEESLLLDEANIEFSVAPDGSGISYCSSKSHTNMNLFVLPLQAAAGELPRAAGPPKQLTNGEGQWHVHNGGWSPDSARIILTRDTDVGDVYVMDGALR